MFLRDREISRAWGNKPVKMKRTAENKTAGRPEAAASLSRHRRKCVVCRHPDREAIEAEYLHWHSVWDISQDYEIADYRSIHRHARAYGLVPHRRENILSALDTIVERSAEARVTADSIIRAYSCITESGEWVEPPTRVVFSVVRPAPESAAGAPAPVEQPVESPAEAAAVLGVPESAALIYGRGIRNPANP
jgi:hypothetical protein